MEGRREGEALGKEYTLGVGEEREMLWERGRGSKRDRLWEKGERGGIERGREE